MLCSSEMGVALHPSTIVPTYGARGVNIPQGRRGRQDLMDSSQFPACLAIASAKLRRRDETEKPACCAHYCPDMTDQDGG
jgi:hypothetical protein